MTISTSWETFEDVTTYFLAIEYAVEGATSIESIGINVMTRDPESDVFEEWGFVQREG